MSLYVLDTDTLTLWLRDQPRVCERLLAHDPAELCTTIVTIEETQRLVLAPGINPETTLRFGELG